MAFLVPLVIHIIAGLACIVTGAVASESKKRQGRHIKWGTVYYWSFFVVFLSATVMAVMRWSKDYYLFIVVLVAFGLATLGYVARKIHWRHWVVSHIVGMLGSYIGLFTGFLVDNAHEIPLIKQLPNASIWFLPAAIGMPFMIRALWKYSPRRNDIEGDNS